MTRLLEDAFRRVAALPEDEQDRLARLILDELAEEDAWAQSFAHSQGQLSRLARDVRDQIAKGEVVDRDPADDA